MKKDISTLIKQLEDAANELHPLQKQIIKNALKNVQQTYDADGEFTSFDDTKRLLWEYSIKSAKKEIFAIATNRHGLSGFGFTHNQKLIDIQEEAIKKGVTIHRIFAVSKTDYERFDFMELVRAQLKAGIDVWIAYDNRADFINSELENEKENYVIVDNTLLYRSFIVGKETHNSITFDSPKIKKYQSMFVELKEKSYQFKEEDLPKSFTAL